MGATPVTIDNDRLSEVSAFWSKSQLSRTYKLSLNSRGAVSSSVGYGLVRQRRWQRRRSSDVGPLAKTKLQPCLVAKSRSPDKYRVATFHARRLGNPLDRHTKITNSASSTLQGLVGMVTEIAVSGEEMIEGQFKNGRTTSACGRATPPVPRPRHEGSSR